MKTIQRFLKAQLINLAGEINLDKLSEQFDQISQDPYLKEGYRFKEIARYRMDHSRVIRQAHGPLFQDNKHNPTHGGIIRHYNPFDPTGKAQSEIHKVVKIFAQQSGLTADNEILFQAQRIISTQKLTGLPAVEGWHKDGTTYIGMMCINRHNVKGGMSQLSFDKGKSTIFNHTLQPGELVLLDDRSYWHYATPIQPENPNQLAYRDIIIICTPSCREPEVAQLRRRA